MSGWESVRLFEFSTLIPHLSLPLVPLAFFVPPRRTRPRSSHLSGLFVVLSHHFEEFCGWMGGAYAFGH
jgi:hypothetical protein